MGLGLFNRHTRVLTTDIAADVETNAMELVLVLVLVLLLHPTSHVYQHRSHRCSLHRSKEGGGGCEAHLTGASTIAFLGYCLPQQLLVENHATC